MRYLACIILSVSTTLSAFEFNHAADGTPIRWNNSVSISWMVDPNAPPSVRTAFVEGLSRWAAATGSALTFVEKQGGIEVKYNTLSTLGSTGAFTTNEVISNQIVRSTIELNAKDYQWDGAYAPFLGPTLLHELGHALGLSHPKADGSNVAGAMNAQDTPTMWAAIQLCAGALHFDDIVGIRTIYGVDIASVAPTFSCTEKHRGRIYTFQSSDAPDQIFWTYGDGTTDSSAVHRYNKGVFTVNAESRGRTGTLNVQIGPIKRSAQKAK